MDNIHFTGIGIKGIQEVKSHFENKFIIKDIGKLRYFLEIEIIDKV